MSDVAAGSSAALQLQQNMAAAPNVQQVEANRMEEANLKLQQDRLKAQYAPQEAAIKLQQDEAALAKSKLDAVISQAKIQKSEEISKLEKTFAADPENQKLNTTEYATKLAKAMFAVDPDKADKMMKFASEAEVKDALAASKKSDNDFKQIGSAYAALSGMKTPQEFESMLERLSPEQKDLIEKQIPGFLQEKNPTVQKSQLENSLLYHSSATLQFKLTHDENMRRMQVESAEAIAKEQIHSRERLRQSALSHREDPETKANNKANTMYTTGKGEIDRKYSRLEDKGEQELRDAKQELRDNQNYPSKKLAAQQRVKEANDYLNKISKERSDEYYSLARRLPKSETRDEILSGWDAAKQPNEPAAKKEPDNRSDKGDSKVKPAATSNKPATKLSDKEIDSAISAANKAISQGADPNKVKARLKEAGISIKE